MSYILGHKYLIDEVLLKFPLIEDVLNILVEECKHKNCVLKEQGHFAHLILGFDHHLLHFRPS